MFQIILEKITRKFKNLTIIKQILIQQGLKLHAENIYRDQNMSLFMRTKNKIDYIFKTKIIFNSCSKNS